MLHVVCDKDIDRRAWSRLVAESQTGTWFQSPDAYDFFASLPELFDVFAVGIADCRLKNEDCKLRAICVGYVTKEKNALRQFFTRRAIIIGGPCLADDCTLEEVETLMRAVRSHLRFKIADCRMGGGKNNKFSIFNVQCALRTPIYIETRNFNDYSQWREAFETAGFAYQPHLNFHVDTSSPEIVETNLGKSRKRDIRTTVREGVTIVELTNERVKELGNERVSELVSEFYAILQRLYRTKVKTPLFPLSFFQALAKHPDGRFLLTEYQGRIIGGTVCVAFQKSPMSNLQSTNTTPAGVVYEWFACGEDGVYPHIFPSCYATYAGIRYAAEHGCPRFDMMGAGKPGKDYGVRDFKAKFGGKEVEHGRYMCVLRPMLFKIGTIGVRILKHLKF